MFKKILGLLLCAVLVQPAAIFSSDADVSDAAAPCRRQPRLHDVNPPESLSTQLANSLKKAQARLEKYSFTEQQIITLIYDAFKNGNNYRSTRLITFSTLCNTLTIEAKVSYYSIELTVVSPRFRSIRNFNLNDQHNKFKVKGLRTLMKEIKSFMYEQIPPLSESRRLSFD